LAGCLGRDAERALEKAQEIASEAYKEEEEAAEVAEILSSLQRPIPRPPPEPSGASSNVQLSPVPLRAAAPPKQGRNEPCACGSGVKFKRCCGSGTREASARQAPLPPLQALAG